MHLKVSYVKWQLFCLSLNMFQYDIVGVNFTSQWHYNNGRMQINGLERSVSDSSWKSCVQKTTLYRNQVFHAMDCKLIDGSEQYFNNRQSCTKTLKWCRWIPVDQVTCKEGKSKGSICGSNSLLWHHAYLNFHQHSSYVQAQIEATGTGECRVFVWHC